MAEIPNDLDMLPPTADPLLWAPVDLSYPTQSFYIPQQAFAPYGAHVALNSASQVQSQDGQLATGQSYMLHSSDASLAPHNGERNSTGWPSDTQNIPAIPMGPPARPRKRKAPTLRAGDWEPYKARIVELHITEGIPLKDVKKRIEQEFGFTAELRQYRTRISQWKMDKNVKPQEMRAIVRKKQQRKLAEVNKGELVFEVRGNKVEPQKIDRWMKRHDIPESQLYAPSPAASTPSAVYCRTISERGSPVPSSVYSPAAPFLPESITPAAQSPAISSPALSISSIVRPQRSTFTGQSPAPSHRSLPPFLPGSVPGPSFLQNQLDIATGSLQYRYKQTEEESLREELSQVEAVFGTGHPKALSILLELGKTLAAQGRYKSAEEVIRRVIEVRQTVGSDDDVDRLSALDVLGEVLGYQGLYAKAEKLLLRTFKSRKIVLGDEHPATLTSMSNLASTYRDQGRSKEAEELKVQVLETRKRVLGDEHRDTLLSMGNLASTYRDQGRSKEAEELKVQVLETRKRVLGDEHPDTLLSMGNLALTYRDQGRSNEAEELELQVLETRKRVLGDEHPATLISMSNLASTYRDQGRSKEAEELKVQVLETRKRVLGDEHPATLISMGNLASTYSDQGRSKEAEELEVQVLETRKRVLGDEHPATLISMSNLAFTLKSQSRNLEAISLMEACIQLRKRILGDQHPKTESSLKILNIWQIEIGL